MAKDQPKEKGNGAVAPEAAPPADAQIERPTCGIVMPISELDGLGPAHWTEVKAILSEAIEKAGFRPRLVSDAEEIGKGHFPLYAAGVTHRGPYKDGPGEINVPIAIDGMVIEPGDLIVGDADGLLCVPYDQAEALLEATHRKMEAEKKNFNKSNKAAGGR
jgi:regulator of RNase E activity RraA